MNVIDEQRSAVSDERRNNVARVVKFNTVLWGQLCQTRGEIMSPGVVKRNTVLRGQLCQTRGEIMSQGWSNATLFCGVSCVRREAKYVARGGQTQHCFAAMEKSNLCEIQEAQGWGFITRIIRQTTQEISNRNENPQLDRMSIPGIVYKIQNFMREILSYTQPVVRGPQFDKHCFFFPKL
jgi:hypothetical protein